jgi:hypothetical protein
VSTPLRQTIFDLFRADGTVERGLDGEEVLRRILTDEISEAERIALPGGVPRPYWQYPSYEELRDPEARRQAAIDHRSRSGGASVVVRPGGGVAVRPSSLAQASAASGQPPRRVEQAVPNRPPKLLPDSLLKLRPAPLLQRLLDSELHEVLGADSGDSPGYLSACARGRVNQLREHFEPRVFSDQDRQLVEKVQGLVAQAFVLSTSPEHSDRVRARQRELGRQPLMHELVELAPSDVAALHVVGAQSPEAVSKPVDDGMIRVRGEEELMRMLQTPPPAKPEPRAAARAAARASTPESAPRPPREARRRAPADEGDQTTGPLTWGVGSIDTGVRTGAFPMIAVWFVMVGLLVGTDWGRLEAGLAADDAMHYIRVVVLVAATLGCLRLLRREAPSRLGARPVAAWQWGLGLLGGLGGAALAQVWQTAPTVAYPVVAVVAFSLLRGFSEALFFEGYVARTLNVEAQESLPGIAAPALGSAAYMASYFEVLRATGLGAPGIMGVWLLLVGLPAALLMRFTRSWLVAGLYRSTAWATFYLLQAVVAVPTL